MSTADDAVNIISKNNDKLDLCNPMSDSSPEEAPLPVIF